MFHPVLDVLDGVASATWIMTCFLVPPGGHVPIVPDAYQLEPALICHPASSQALRTNDGEIVQHLVTQSGLTPALRVRLGIASSPPSIEFASIILENQANPSSENPLTSIATTVAQQVPTTPPGSSFAKSTDLRPSLVPTSRPCQSRLAIRANRRSQVTSSPCPLT